MVISKVARKKGDGGAALNRDDGAHRADGDVADSGDEDDEAGQ
ncbi:hypothetical protein [Desulfatitalea tepidiphila]|nr:hypothetical protein [Desulfatitalea tepidiphila]